MDYFVTAQEKLECTTNPKLFDNFPKQLMEYHKRVFMNIIDGDTKTVPHFNDAFNKFKYEVLGVNHYK